MLKVARAVGVLAALTIGVGACGGGAGPAKTVAQAPITNSTADTTPEAAAAAAAQATTAPTTPATPAAPAPTTPPSATAKSPSAPATTKKPITPAPTTATTPAAPPAPVPTTPSLAARRQPATTEVNALISSVHAAIPFVVLTAAQVASAGDQICTAFDQGQTVAQVEAAVAASFGNLISPPAAAGPIKTLVTMYCPAYASKLG